MQSIRHSTQTSLKLNKIQRKALLNGTGALPSTSTAELNVLTGELPLHLRRQELILKYVARLSTHAKTHPTYLAINKCNTTFRKTLKNTTSMGTLVHELKTKLPIDIFQVENNITYDKEH